MPPSDEELRQKSVMELCELIEEMARTIHNQQEIIELLNNANLTV